MTIPDFQQLMREPRRVDDLDWYLREHGKDIRVIVGTVPYRLSKLPSGTKLKWYDAFKLAWLRDAKLPLHSQPNSAADFPEN